MPHSINIKCSRNIQRNPKKIHASQNYCLSAVDENTAVHVSVHGASAITLSLHTNKHYLDKPLHAA